MITIVYILHVHDGKQNYTAQKGQMNEELTASSLWLCTEH